MLLIAACAGGASEAERRAHWAYQPLKRPGIPRVADADAARNPVDAFVRAKLKEAGLKPASSAQPRDLARRVANVLTGLPPEKQELQRLLDGHSRAAYESYVDRLLASPHFGEHWARHWMDA